MARQELIDWLNEQLYERRVTAALGRVFASLMNPKALDLAVDTIGGGEGERALHDDRERAERHAADLEEQRLRLAHALAAGKMSADVYYKVDGELAERLSAERQRILDLTRTLEALPDVDRRREALITLTRNFAATVEALEPSMTSSILQRAGVKVIIDNGSIVTVRLFDN